MEDIDSKRKHPRKLVHLKVTYGRASEFVEQYATNLSAGGMFLPTTNAKVGDVVAVTLELPLHGTLDLHCEVMHVSPRGAGLRIVDGPIDAQELLEAYLMRLGRRAAATVYCNTDPWLTLIKDAGYNVLPVPPLGELRTIFAELRAMAVMPPVEEADDYANALEAVGADPELIVPVHPDLPVEPVLAWLDERLLT